MGHYTEEIERNAKRINQLKSRIDETVKHRDKSEDKRREWKKACADFHQEYDALAFPGGYSGALIRLVEGDRETIEAALCFLECRPYFFRSGYMFKDILRKAKQAPLSRDQGERLAKIAEAYRLYRESKRC
jgi:DNA repair exonuclease SbcCD ATPase subunit